MFHELAQEFGSVCGWAFQLYTALPSIQASPLTAHNVISGKVITCLNLGFLICKLRLIVVSVPQSHCEDLLEGVM